MNMSEVRTLAQRQGYTLDLSRSTLHGSKYAGGTLISGFAINLRTGESSAHALSLGGAMLARHVADQVLKAAGFPAVGISVDYAAGTIQVA